VVLTTRNKQEKVHQKRTQGNIVPAATLRGICSKSLDKLTWHHQYEYRY